MSLLNARNSPPYDVAKYQPLALEQLDNHADSGRIWATILQLREDADTLLEDGLEKAANDTDGDDEYQYAMDVLAALDTFVSKGYTKTDLEALRTLIAKA